ncbi:uncharacterized protein LOC105447054 [Strongylocentrotus purpuratus]|uniref:Uncharacterized protein n=1 Tax=Strongylocentrotus purpuratus TaxID=7668 RepID=A0A7M7NSZ3_STRPU|nr:uncharacterized protein LOC105447054 [Strongylocentrotus purpuratus]XP_030841270.1 uncharacterized protein LOC105447054 [Strongylocentrotus purpuratus]|eukprot:XP_011682962.1 PREDICTED: uncharacterized protein LOC105447054 [Strongylocentrotus purpuratus]
MNTSSNLTVMVILMAAVILSHFQPSLCQIHHRFNCWRPGGKKRSDPDSSATSSFPPNSGDHLQLKWSLQRYIDSVPASELINLLSQLLQFENMRRTKVAVPETDADTNNDWISSPTDEKDASRTWS